MPHLVLHIGRSKTGSTMLQEFLALNRDRLADRGLTVPDLFAGPNHAELALAFSATAPERLTRAHAVSGPSDRARLATRIDHKLAAAVRPGSVWLMTSEHLASQLRTTDEISRLHALLGRHFDRIDVLVYLRRPDHLAPSLYAEAVKAGRTAALGASFIRQRNRAFDHAGLLTQWRQAFGTVTPRPYLESRKATPAALVDDALATVSRLGGLEVAPGPDWTWPERAANQSLSAEGTEFLRLVNPQVPTGAVSREQRRRLVAELRGRCSGGPVRLTPAAATALEESGLRTGGLQRDDFTPEPDWCLWFDEPAAPTGRPHRLAQRRLVSLMADLSAPRGPITWGGRRTPQWVPDSAWATVRRATVRVVRR